MTHYENPWKNGKIIAIVDCKTGRTVSYDYITAYDPRDYFSNPEDRKKYGAVLIKLLPSVSEDELKRKFTEALELLLMGTYLATYKGRRTMKSLSTNCCSIEWKHWINEEGLLVNDFDFREIKFEKSFLVSRKARPQSVPEDVLMILKRRR